MSATAIAVEPVSFGTRLTRGLTKVGLAVVVVFALVALLMVLGVIPVRAYVIQKHELAATRGRLEMLSERNSALEQQALLLHTDAEMERLALDQFGMVRPGERLTVIPGLRSEGSRLDAVRTDVESPAPSAQEPKHPSRLRALFDALTFWK